MTFPGCDEKGSASIVRAHVIDVRVHFRNEVLHDFGVALLGSVVK